jgi:hypothetical protein
MRLVSASEPTRRIPPPVGGLFSRSVSPQALQRRQLDADRAFLTQGITFTVDVARGGPGDAADRFTAGPAAAVTAASPTFAFGAVNFVDRAPGRPHCTNRNLRPLPVL